MRYAPPMNRFDLAPMTPALRIMTAVLFVIPAALGGFGAMSPLWPVRVMLTTTGLFTLVLYATVWLVMRPSCFELDETELRIVWPVRTRVIARSKITGARRIASEEFRAKYGLGMRVGAGGLWGGFGLLKTSTETFSMWISRTDEQVLVTVEGERTLMITPEDPARFVEAIERHL